MRFSAFGRPREKMLGLDLQPDHLTLVQLGGTFSSSPVLQAYRMADHPSGDVDAQAEALARTWRTLGTRQRRVAVAVAAERIRFRLLQVPSTLPRRALRAVLQAEAGGLLDAAPDDISMDYQVLPARPGETAAEHNVLLCVALRPQLDILSTIVNQAGLKVGQIQVDLFARLNAWTLAALDDELHRGRRLVLHVEPTRMLWHALLPNDKLPEPTGLSMNFPLDHTGAPDLDSACRGIGPTAPDTILLSGPCQRVQMLMDRLRARFPDCSLLANPFRAIGLAPTLDRAEVTRAAPGLIQAFGLAVGA
jgi:Tfp pilus assembly PilM family ATPase